MFLGCIASRMANNKDTVNTGEDLNDVGAQKGGTGIYKDPKENRSYAPVRHGIKARWLVDGRVCFEQMISKIEIAKSHVYMSFWIFVPTIYMRRYSDDRDPLDRLDNILKRVADSGVKIYILLWDETNLAMSNKSKFNKHYVEGLSKNIVVVRHPPIKPVQYSHHQKFVVVDDKYGFLGGIDMSTGRYDWDEHRVVDPDGRYWWGLDYYAPLVKKADKYEDPDKQIVDQSEVARMPWHDIDVYIEGEAVIDLTYNFVQRWNHHVNFSSKYRGKDKYPMLTCKNMAWYSDYDKYWDGNEAENRAPTPVVDEKPSLMKSLVFSGNVIQKTDSDKDLDEDQKDTTEGKDDTEKSLVKSIYARKKAEDFKYWFPRSHVVDCQLVRSICKWSGADRTETSIYGSYLDIIKDAQHYVYVENQFFVSGNAEGVGNLVSNAIVDRISAAINEGRKFKAIIVTTQPEDLTNRVVPLVQYQYNTISRGGTSMIEVLKDRHPGIDLDEYLGFFQLRSHGIFPSGKLAHEQIFVHSKVMLVDDKKCVIASANLNDRSFSGKRDSELGMVITGGETIDSVMSGKPYKANAFVYGLRMHLMIEHLGLDFGSEVDHARVQDINKDRFYKDLWLKTARTNTDVFESVFPEVPRDSYLTFSEYEVAKTQPPNNEKKSKLSLIKGHLCFYPTRFLCAETPTLWSSILDSAVYT